LAWRLPHALHKGVAVFDGTPPVRGVAVLFTFITVINLFFQPEFVALGAFLGAISFMGLVAYLEKEKSDAVASVREEIKVIREDLEAIETIVRLRK
jgi:uncharacterized membrane protein